MVTRLLFAGLLLVCCSARMGAELKYTAHMELKKAETPPSQPVNPILAMMSDGLAQQLLPEGPMDLIFVIGEKGTRTEYTKAAMGQPAGTVTIALPDGTLTVLNPKEQTYWKTTVDAATGAVQAAGIKPQADAKRTGEFATVAGLRCERVLVDLRIDLPIPEAARSSLPPGFPSSLVMDGESCVSTDQYQKYIDLAAKSKATGDFLAALGLDKLMQGGIVLRQIMRLSGMEMSSVVTAIGEEDVPASAFEIPAGYKEVPPPTGIK